MNVEKEIKLALLLSLPLFLSSCRETVIEPMKDYEEINLKVGERLEVVKNTFLRTYKAEQFKPQGDYFEDKYFENSVSLRLHKYYFEVEYRFYTQEDDVIKANISEAKFSNNDFCWYIGTSAI